MKEVILAKRYAEAFLSFAKPTIGFERAVEEIVALKLLLCEVPSFKLFIESRWIPYGAKCQALDAALKDFSQETRQFLKLLLNKGRITELLQVVDYVRNTYEGGEAINALLSTSYLLDEDLVEKIKTKLETKFKKKLRLFIKLDPDLLGGVKVSLDHKLLDGSVASRLEALKTKLKTVKVG
jgi:F-type H+-transporting ATPase subunit delta